MKLKKLIGAASVAAILSGASVGASAFSGTLDPVPFSGNSFNNLLIGTITTTDPLSDLVGSLFAVPTVSITIQGPTGPILLNFSLDSVTFNSASVGVLTGDLDVTNAGFSFQNVLAGSYEVMASGSLNGGGQVSDFAFIGANYTVTAVPEPESYALFLAGLGIMGAIARRRSKANAV